MNETEIRDAPHLNLDHSRDDSQWRREYMAFLRLLPELLKTIPGKYVAVHHGEVVSTGDTSVEAAMQAYDALGYVPLHVGLVSDTPPKPIRLPSPRIVRRERP
jgi:hypothetical protein